MSNFPGPKTINQKNPETDIWEDVPIETEEEALKAYFHSDKYGDKKYNEYKNYLKTKSNRATSRESNKIYSGGWGDLDFNSEILKQSGAIDMGLNDAKDLHAQNFFKDFNPKQRELISRFIPDIHGNLTNLKTFNKRSKDEKDFEGKFGRPLLKTETIQGRTYTPNFFLQDQPTGYMGNVKKQEKELNKIKENLLKDYNDINDKVINWEKNTAPYQELFKSYEKELKDLGEVNSYSDPEEIKKYNNILSKIDKTNNEVLEKGFDKIRIDILKAQEVADRKRDDLMKMAGRYNNQSIAQNAAKLNYDNFERSALQLEKLFIGGGAMLGSYALQGLAYITEGVQSIGEQTERKNTGVNVEWDNSILDAAKMLTEQAVDYNQRLEENLNNNYARKFKYDETDFGTYIAQTLADQSPSIVAVFGPMIGAKLLTAATTRAIAPMLLTSGGKKAIQTNLMNAATKVTMGAMFMQSGGAALSNYEIAGRNAQKIIDMNEVLLKNATTEDEKIRYRKAIANATAAQDATFFQKALSGVIHGGIEMYAEKLGTLRYLRNARLIKTTSGLSKPIFRFLHRGALQTWGLSKQAAWGVGVEFIEE